MATRRRTPTALLTVVLVGLAWSGVAPHAWLTWLMETVWVALGAALVVATWRRLPLTTLLCCLLAGWALALSYGGHYGYANTPAGDAVQGWLDLARNPYDRLGHFLQGLVPAITVREVLARRSPLRSSRWLSPLTLCCCLALSATWELVEWLGAVVVEGGDPEFLGGQGDPWDTQWDMLLALIGAVVSLVAFATLHDRQLAQLNRTATARTVEGQVR